jgi:DNA-binding MarR family transcriptional regulator
MSSTHPDLDAAQRVSFGLIRLMKMLQAMRLHAPRLHPAVDTAAYPLLFNLAAEPRRVSALAECIHSDISTVSRQVSTLVGHGLLEKVSDPDDGRAQVVRLSAEGHDLLARIQEQRNEWFRTLLDDWSNEEAAEFAGYLERFGDRLEQSREQIIGRRTATTTPASREEN